MVAYIQKQKLVFSVEEQEEQLVSFEEYSYEIS